MFTGGICVVGRGRWGNSLLAALKARGIAAASADLRKPVKTSPAKLSAAWLEAEVLWLCVPDAEIAGVTRRVVAAVRKHHGSLQGQIVLHSSGVYSSDILQMAREYGAAVGSVHPLMSFPTRTPVAVDGVPFAVEAAGRLKTKLFEFVRALGGEPFSIRAEGKVLYHAAAVMASPLLVSLATAVDETSRLAGLSRKEAKALMQPIMEATLSNFFLQGGDKSFSGPFARGDAKTVSLHLQALAAHPLLSLVYRSLALQALATLPVENEKKLLKTVLNGPHA